MSFSLISLLNCWLTVDFKFDQKEILFTHLFEDKKYPNQFFLYYNLL